METRRAIVMLGLFFLVAGVGFAQHNNASVQQQIIIEVKPITSINVTGDPHSFLIQDPPQGAEFAQSNDNSTTYNVLTNLDNMKIVASINDPMPKGTKLMINLKSSKWNSSGVVDISDAVAPVTAVSGVTRGIDRNQTIDYTFAANANAGEIENETRIVTLTVTD